MRLPPSIVAALALLAPPALAQQATPPAQDDSLLVTGRADGKSPERVFVEALAVPSGKRQLARLEDDVCPAAFGLRAADSAALIARMRRVATVAGVPLAKPDCRPNVIVLVVPKRREAIEHWRIKRPDFFEGLTQREIHALAEAPGPVAAWQIVHIKGAGGRQISQSASETFDYYVVPNTGSSRLGSEIQLEFFASFVLVEAPAIGDASLTQLADYAAMRAYARTDATAAAAQPLPTILSLFERPGEPIPLSLTKWDLRFLKALYSAPLAAKAYDQQRVMAREVQKEAAAAE